MLLLVPRKDISIFIANVLFVIGEAVNHGTNSACVCDFCLLDFLAEVEWKEQGAQSHAVLEGGEKNRVRLPMHGTWAPMEAQTLKRADIGFKLLVAAPLHF